MTAITSRTLVPAAALTVALLMSACGRDDPDALVASAQDYLSRNDAPAAIIQLKNALQSRPDSAKARLLLGQALLDTGDAQGAETEFRKAQDLGVPPAEVVPQLALALLRSRQYSKITSDYAGQQLADAQAQASLQTTLAIAWQRQGDEAKAQGSLGEALKAKADYAPALIEQARSKVRGGDVDGALAGLGQIPRQSPVGAEALKLRGDILLHSKRDADAAMAAYRDALEVKPSYVEGQAAIVELLISQGKTTAAAESLQALEKAAPGRPQTLYLQAMLAYTKGDFKAAQENVQKLVRMAPESARALELAGMTDLQLGANAQAEASLAKALQLNPGLAMARRGLVTSYMRLGRLDKAIATLPSDIDGNDRDPGMLGLAGQAYMLQGDVDRAQRYFARASRLVPNDAVMRTSLAVSHLASGKGDAALGELRSIAASDEGVVADMALINALLQERKVEEALKAIDLLEKKRPADVLPVFLRGRALLLKQDTAGARKAMERALEIDPGYFPAAGVLAVLDNAEKRPDDARARIEAAIKRDPGNVQAYMVLMELRAANGADRAELAGILRKAVDGAPSSPIPRQLLVDHYLRGGETKEALAVAQQAVAALPDNAQLFDALGRAQSANGEHNQALASFNRMAALQPQSPVPYLRMAGANLISGDRAAAGQSWRKALEIDPTALEAQQGLVRLAMADRKSDDALAMSRTVQKQRPKEAAGYALEGEIHVAEKAWDKAIDVFRAGLKQVPASGELAVRLHEVLVTAGKKSEADRLATEWQRSHAKDATFPLYLGTRALAAKDLPESLRQYERAVALQPNNAIALNNMAWIKGQLGRDGALADAERANALAPNQPAFMDTWAMLLSAASQHARAVDLQKRVVQLRPQQLEFKLNLAKIYIKAGQKDAAKAVLDELAAAGARFPAQAEVEELRKAL
ncbi:XrtA/PEP-CTERM system TPR-repeat protein PrsT [Alicycliphilus denitrificans]|uniref:XrtA/PEP-CTERM system TPR-repeat protein PrsT n=1 Tax=Alicycliphilus denitrificans TaxID=179636 RepID=UPI0009676ADF|nr:XrtA/PEP-CTERM system TPR-repeat protein PrsT [Alicycliphilus denitrificans]MBN9574838.1 PEP-CTERM system TPR-repeat protein PrsT [Alicycliphilus denitrificans]OJW89209.1 MAG: exosortase [Alicycliphilus sp. 69-12]